MLNNNDRNPVTIPLLTSLVAALLRSSDSNFKLTLALRIKVFYPFLHAAPVYHVHF